MVKNHDNYNRTLVPGYISPLDPGSDGTQTSKLMEKIGKYLTL